ncbi:SusC/RagA family TonB-linked outer membrane protein [Sphingobacterium sp. SGR-19]|uniref:SusC/RagA family TonB-linked outer membrane protein n=1 Tax=Sphingobacterium sp. SGR-19 TaxID=2710886 RepID=UPI0013EA4899|nr:TonB-dependent receptor [Sphingobacterium sp. SGR-19]NGM65765.1 TonB-dependent receptor [Sphingobacterium sp. SGR-19]
MNKRNLWFKLCLVASSYLLSSVVSVASPATEKVVREIQQTNVEGTVVDAEGRPLAGATVRVSGQQAMTSTDAKGRFLLAVSEGQLLSISYTGYHSKEVEATPGEQMLVTLLEDEAALDEVVVVGYSAQRRSSVTGAVASVNMTDLETRRVPNVAQSLQGQVAGVQITQTSGAPGDGINVRIRGEGTIGNNNPLYVVDGVPSRDITFLNPSDIESMSVLKDASAAAIYGSRASGGVVVITTKQGKAGQSALNINYFTGLQQVANLPQMLNTQQYLEVSEIAWNNSGKSGENPYTLDKSRTDLADTDWLDELFETGKTNSVELSASGGNDKTQYLISGGYYRQNGIIIYDNDKYERINFRANVNSALTERFKIGTNLQLTYSQRDQISAKGDGPGIVRHAMLRPPLLAVYKDPTDPTWSARDPFTDLPFYRHNSVNGGYESDKYEYSRNPLAIAYFTDDVFSRIKTFGNVYGEYALLSDKSLKFRTNVGIDLNVNHTKAFFENYGDDDGAAGPNDLGKGRINRPEGLNEDRGTDFTLTWNNVLSYEKAIGLHQINALAGTEFINNNAAAISGSRRRYDYTLPTFRYLDYGSTLLDVWNGGAGSEYSLFSLFGSATYEYDGKYMVTANLRADESSRFGENNRWGYFPSVSVGWTMSRERFMQNVDWISDLRLRASTGALGNQEIDNYAYLTLMRRAGENYLIDRYGNPDLKWETTIQHNVGVDLALFKNQVTFTADYFIKDTRDILLPISLPSFVGDVQPTIINAGRVKNRGFEFSLGYRKTTEGGFRYGVNANLATLSNEVAKLHPNVPYISGTATRTAVGNPLNAYFGYVQEGIYQNQEEINTHLSGVENPPQKPGDIRFRDFNGDGVINDQDRDFMGSPIPKLTYGLNLSAAYKGFDFAALIQGVQGVDRYNDGRKILDYDTRPFNYTTDVLGAWNGEGTSNTIPRLTQNDNGSSRVSTIVLENASYARLKNLEVGYSFGSLVKKANVLKNMRVYISGQNLWTITDYKGLDPESTDLIDMGTYPSSRTFLFGINVTF